MSAAQKARYEESSETRVPDWAGVAISAWDAPSWKEAAADYHKARNGRSSIVEIEPEKLRQLRKLMDDDISLEQVQRKLLERRRDGAAASTVEALMFGLRDGIDALPTKPERLRRLSELSETQLREVCARLQNFKPAIARPWTADEVEALVAIWAKSHA